MGKTVTSKSDLFRNPVLAGAKRERPLYRAYREDGSVVTFIHAVDWYDSIHRKGLLERPPGSPEPEPVPEPVQGEMVVDVVEEIIDAPAEPAVVEEIIDEPGEQIEEEQPVAKSVRKIKRS